MGGGEVQEQQRWGGARAAEVERCKSSRGEEAQEQGIRRRANAGGLCASQRTCRSPSDMRNMLSFTPKISRMALND
jgi:hypothetical protein